MKYPDVPDPGSDVIEPVEHQGEVFQSVSTDDRHKIVENQNREFQVNPTFRNFPREYPHSIATSRKRVVDPTGRCDTARHTSLPWRGVPEWCLRGSVLLTQTAS
jgi:hypothetical protein